MKYLPLAILPLVFSFLGWSNSQTPEPSRLIVLSETFVDIHILWHQDEPLSQLGDWLKALKIRFELSDNGIWFETPNKVSCFWAKDSTKVDVGGQTVDVNPLQQQEGSFWVPIVSLARLLGLKAIVNAEKRTVKLVSSLQSVEAKRTELGWLVTLTFSYPLPNFPKTGTLHQPERAYADFAGAAIEQVNLPELKDATPLTGLRLGQFTDEPPVVRFVADASEPVLIRVAGKELTEEGSERWHLLIQPETKPKQWFGQIFLKENEAMKAVILILGRLESGIALKQVGKSVTVSLPEKPIFNHHLAISGDGIIESVSVDTEGVGTRLTISLREPATAHWQFEGNEGIAVLIEALSNRAKQIRLIVVDAGHGGKDPGAMSPPSQDKPRLVEKELTLDIAFRLKRLLEQAGYKVLMTRTDDTYVPLPTRVTIANSVQAHAFVSVHLNSYPYPGGQWGTEVYYWTPQSYPLAESVYRHLLALLGRKGNGIRQRKLYVTRNTIMPSVLVESCYLNHPEEEELLRSEEFRERIALAICRGLMEFFGDLKELKPKGE